MAVSIVAHQLAEASAPPGITRSSRWSCNIYAGTAGALIAAGRITPDQLHPQNGRTPGHTAFYADGTPCPAHLRAWRNPGFKVIRQQKDGTYSVEVTVDKDVQVARRDAERAVEHEARQQLIDSEIAADGHKYRNWQLTQHIDDSHETWEGTKAQLQAAGLGEGLRFPGEPGGPAEHLYCKCPLGFEFRIHLPNYIIGKAAAGIYTAHSWFVRGAGKPTRYVEHAPGVIKEVWAPGGWQDTDWYFGNAMALVSAGLVPNIGLFPGQPNTNKMQASYREGWLPAASNGSAWTATIRKKGKGEFSLQVPVDEDERKRRAAVSHTVSEEKKKQARVLADERKRLRQGTDRTGKSAGEFRAERARFAEVSVEFLWKHVFGGVDGALAFDIPEDSDVWAQLGDAFQAIRDAVQDAEIVVVRADEVAARNRLRLVASRGDAGLQRLIRDASHLRLVRPAQNEKADDE